MTFGQAIKAARRRQRLRREQVCAAAGISPAYLGKLERGDLPPPSAQVIDLLARALGANVDELCRLGRRIPPDIEAFILGDRRVVRALRAAMERQAERNVA